MPDVGQPSQPPAGTVRIAPPAEVAPRLGVGRLARHVLMCAGPDCCPPHVGDGVWGVFKRRLSGLGLTGNRPTGPTVYRTRCECLRMCAQGPIVVVYPEGAWYERVDEAAAEKIISEHVLRGEIVREHCFALNPLAGGTMPSQPEAPPPRPPSPSPPQSSEDTLNHSSNAVRGG